MAENGQPVSVGAAFGGLVSLHGPLDPALAYRQYRILARDTTRRWHVCPAGPCVLRGQPPRSGLVRDAQLVRLDCLADLAGQHDRRAGLVPVLR